MAMLNNQMVYMMDIYSRTPSPCGTSSFPSSVYNCLFSVKNIQRGCIPLSTLLKGVYSTPVVGGCP
jgi:hypothetical protein